MLPIAPARTNREWEGVQPLPGLGGEDNLGWLGRATQTLTSKFGDALKSQELVRLVVIRGHGSRIVSASSRTSSHPA